MFLLIAFIGLIIFLIYIAQKPSEDSRGPSFLEKNIIIESNKSWTRFIHGYSLLAKTKSQKELLAKMLRDVEDQGLISPGYLDSLDNSSGKNKASNKSAVVSQLATTTAHISADRHKDKSESINTASNAPSEKYQASKLEIQPKDNSIKLDNISLLLYFGAFLFVASVGLFVSFSGANGWIKALSVLAVSLIMYCVGHWIYRTKQTLKPAGLAFIGIGVVIAPLVGFAVYSYVDNTSPGFVWMLTSLFCLGIYSHAILTIRNPLLDYVFIFTLLSLFESSVSVLDFPVYYFGWVMVAVGLLLQAISLWKKVLPDFGNVSRSGGQLYVPLAIFVSLVMLSSHGFSQMGITLLLASFYYGLVFWTSLSDTEREFGALASQVSFLIGISSLVYGFSGDRILTSFILMSASVLHLPVIFWKARGSVIANNFATIMLSSSLVGIVLSVNEPIIMSAFLGITITQALGVWWRQKRIDSYVLAGAGWIALPIIVGQLSLSDPLSKGLQVIWLLLALVAHTIFYLGVARSAIKNNNEHLNTARYVLLLNIVVTALASMLLSPVLCLIALSLVALLSAIISVYDKNIEWSFVSGIVVSLSIIRGWNDLALYLTMVVSLVFNIVLALVFRSEVNRWFSTIIWLVLPLGIGGYFVPKGWGVVYYAWLYIAVMLGLVISRLIANGRVFMSSKIPIATFARTASLSYVAGYVIAGLAVFCLSLYSGSAIGSVTLTILSLLVFVIAWFVERKSEILLLQPILWQIILLTIVKPFSHDSRIGVFVALSTVLASSCYLVADKIWRTSDKKAKFIDNHFIESALLTSFIAPAMYFLTENNSLAMIVGLTIASGLLYHFWRYETQGYREVAVSLTVVSIMWSMGYFGVKEIQAYTHVVAFMLAGFAGWRYINKDNTKTDEYIYLALATATIPLVLQALSDHSGGIYGWWLLLEQVGFMLIGISIHKKFVTLWGLYVAVASVLYQLRNLGYAALAVLAVFVIGVAIYQLQKYNKPDN